MRVLHVIPAVAPRYGGPSSSLIEMCRALREAGAETLIATTNADGDGVLDVPLGTRTLWYGQPAIFHHRHWSEAFKYSRGLGVWLRGHVGEFDVVHIHGPLSYSSLAASHASWTSGVPVIVRPLGTLDSWSLAQKTRRKQVLLPLVRRMLRRAAAVHCTSDEELRDVSTSFALSTGVAIPLGVQQSVIDEPATPDADRSHDRYVLALSRLHPVKNLDALIDAFADLDASGERRGWRLVIGGDGDAAYAAALDSHIAARQAGSHITRLGWMGGDAKRALVRGASVFALPSHHENFGVGLIEAMATGVPAVVGEGVHLSSDIARAGAGWRVDGTSASIAAALRLAIGQDAERQRAAQAARLFAASFAWPAVARQLMDLYGRLTTPARRGAA